MHALIFTAVYSRHIFVWLTFSQTLNGVIAPGIRRRFFAVMWVPIPQFEPKRHENWRGPRRGAPMLWTPCLVRSAGPDGEVRAGLGDPLVDDYLRFVAARTRPNTVLAIVTTCRCSSCITAVLPMVVQSRADFAGVSVLPACSYGIVSVNWT